MDKQKLSIILAIIGVIGAVGGGSYALDFSNTQTTNTTTDNSQTIIHEGDTIINEIINEVIDEEALFDDGYDVYCEEINPDSVECDEYWEELE
jgi:hypothetical protein